ncbi:hypothetical protein EYF80_042249 [Liparis tanakae]|uniref:Uncharacterized protein n=1 Tax=Liparis tanakae TaxID=230148 RepID=A0A4Z2G1U9_9TELE|nr:hypothetical protein EYF80_042249 [Liparis tanakae]
MMLAGGRLPPTLRSLFLKRHREYLLSTTWQRPPHFSTSSLTDLLSRTKLLMVTPAGSWSPWVKRTVENWNTSSEKYWLTLSTTACSCGVNRSTLSTMRKACGPGENSVMHLRISAFSSPSDRSVSKKPGVSIRVIGPPLARLVSAWHLVVSEFTSWPTLNRGSPNRVLARLLFPTPVFPRMAILLLFETGREECASGTLNMSQRSVGTGDRQSSSL